MSAVACPESFTMTMERTASLEILALPLVLSALLLLLIVSWTTKKCSTKMFMQLFIESGGLWTKPFKGGGDQTEQTNQRSLRGESWRRFCWNKSHSCGVELSKTDWNSSQENTQLRGSLLQAQTDISILHSELDKLKNIYEDQRAQHERWGRVFIKAQLMMVMPWEM